MISRRMFLSGACAAAMACLTGCRREDDAAEAGSASDKKKSANTSSGPKKSSSSKGSGAWVSIENFKYKLDSEGWYHLTFDVINDEDFAVCAIPIDLDFGGEIHYSDGYGDAQEISASIGAAFNSGLVFGETARANPQTKLLTSCSVLSLTDAVLSFASVNACVFGYFAPGETQSVEWLFNEFDIAAALLASSGYADSEVDNLSIDLSLPDDLTVEEADNLYDHPYKKDQFSCNSTGALCTGEDGRIVQGSFTNNTGSPLREVTLTYRLDGYPLDRYPGASYFTAEDYGQEPAFFEFSASYVKPGANFDSIMDNMSELPGALHELQSYSWDDMKFVRARYTVDEAKESSSSES